MIQKDKSATLATNNDQYLFQPIAYGISSYESNSMKSSNPHSGIYEADTSRTLDLNGGNPACNQGGIAVVEQIGLIDSIGGQAERVWEGDVAPCLKATHYKSPPSIILVRTYDARENGEGGIVPTLTGDHQNRVTDYTAVVCEPTPIHDQATRFAGKRDERQDGKGNGLGVGNPGDPMNTLTAGDRHAVAYGFFQNTGIGWWNESPIGATVRTPCGGDSIMANVVVESTTMTFQTYQERSGPLMANSHPGSYTGQDAFSTMLVAGIDCRNFTESPELYPTLQAKPNGGQSLNYSGAVRQEYIVRRLTPTECARLQGFPDEWAHPDQKAELTDEEYEFWLNVRNTHAAINGKTVKQYTREQMLRWYNGLHTDSAEYKLWGNGIALPCALYVMEGIAEALKKEDDSDVN